MFIQNLSTREEPESNVQSDEVWQGDYEIITKVWKKDEKRSLISLR